MRKLDRMTDATLLIGLLTFTLLVCCSCGSTKVTTQTIERVSKDTIYLTTQQYDSIYVTTDHYVDRSKDTVLIKETNIEYRYKLLRDTLKVIHRDSIPYQVTVTEVKEVPRPPTFYDYLTRLSFWFLIISLAIWLIFKIRRI